MKIIHKMCVAPSAAMLFLIALGGLSLLTLERQNQRMLRLHDVTFSGFKSTAAQTIALGQIHAGVYSKIAIMASLDEKAVKALSTAIEHDIDNISAEFNKASQTGNKESGLQALAGNALPILQRYKKSVSDAIDMASLDPNTGIASMQTANTEYNALRTLLASAVRDLDAETRTALQSSQEANRNMRWITSATVALSLLVLVLISVVVARSVTGPLNHAIGIAQTVAAGRLDSRFTLHPKDEIGLLLVALEAMNNTLIKVVGEVRVSTDAIALASTELADGNNDLSHRTNTEVASIRQTTVSLATLTDTVQQNAGHAHQASVLAVSASATAERGGAVVGQVIATMGAINEASKRIVDIIGVIDGIAFQTNILALNAAVEAARAGEQGRGFAVVATEVRSLAQRSAAAAKEIKGLISDSVEKVDIGSKLVNEAGATMEEVVSSIRHVTDIMGEITAASQEQSTGIEQVNQAIEQMDQVTQQNAALVEEAAAAAESLQDQAAALARVVATFKLGNEGQSRAPRPATPTHSIAAPAKVPRPLQTARNTSVRQVKASAVAGDEWEEF